MPQVEALGVNPQVPFHAGDPIGPGGFQDQVEVVAHEAIRMHLPLGRLTGLAQRGQKARAVFVVPENLLAVVSAIHNVVNGARIFHAQFARHDAN